MLTHVHVLLVTITPLLHWFHLKLKRFHLHVHVDKCTTSACYHMYMYCTMKTCKYLYKWDLLLGIFLRQFLLVSAVLRIQCLVSRSEGNRWIRLRNDPPLPPLGSGSRLIAAGGRKEKGGRSRALPPRSGPRLTASRVGVGGRSGGNHWERKYRVGKMKEE